jgi:single-strand DNA-binding protein
MSTTVTLVGRLGDDPQIRFTQGGKSVASFSMVTSKSRKNEQTQQWEESETTWYRVEAWDAFGESIVESLAKGDAVIVVGRLFTESFTGKDGNQRTSLKVAAYSVGPDLKRRKWLRGEKAGQSQAAQTRGMDQMPIDDPWQPKQDEEIPF